MKKYKGTLYNSRWDLSTWGLIALTAICCVLPFFLDDDGLMPFVVAVWALISLIVVLKGIYYRIDGNQLVVYQFFIPKAYPVEKISEIERVRSYVSAPATSFSHRIGIRFSDRKILKSATPLVISPVNESDFIARLKQLNPVIKVSL